MSHYQMYIVFKKFVSLLIACLEGQSDRGLASVSGGERRARQLRWGAPAQTHHATDPRVAVQVHMPLPLLRDQAQL